MDMIRLLRADEIECRVGTVSEKGVSLLLYKDARVDQRILDETFGPLGWKRTHQSIDGNLYCTVEIWDDTKQQWIAKQDVGTMSCTEKEKSQASDSFKRACFNVGIGRELYTAPDFIWVPAEKVNLQKRGDKLVTYDRFHVQMIDYDGQRTISNLVIANNAGAVVYSWNTAAARQLKPGLSSTQLNGLQRELERTGIALEEVLKRYHISKPEELNPELYKRAMSSLRKTKAKDSSAA